MANRQQRALRKLTQKDPHNTCYATHTIYKAGGGNSKKHEVEMKDIGVGPYAFIPERAEKKNKQRYRKQRAAQAETQQRLQ